MWKCFAGLDITVQWSYDLLQDNDTNVVLRFFLCMHGWRKVNHLYLLLKQFHFLPPIRFSSMGLAHTKITDPFHQGVCVSVHSIVIASAAPCCCVIHQHSLNVWLMGCSCYAHLSSTFRNFVRNQKSIWIFSLNTPAWFTAAKLTLPGLFMLTKQKSALPLTKYEHVGKNIG